MTAEPMDLPADTEPVSLPKRAPAPPAPMATRRVPAVGQHAVESKPDGTRVEYRPNGTPSRQWNPDGSQVTFDAAGRAAVETLPDGSSITFHADGTATERLLDGTTFQLDAAGHTVLESTPEGTRYTGFDSRGRPTHGVMPDGRQFTLTYDAKGHTIERFADGHLVEAGRSGKVIREVTPDGTTFSRFDADGRPTAGTTAAGKRFSVGYDARGAAVETFADGTEAKVSTPAPRPAVRQVSSGGTTYTGFDGGGPPAAGMTAAGVPFAPTYDPQGGAVERFDDGGSAQSDPGGHAVQQVTPDGTRYTGFDDGGRPTAGMTAAGTPFTISYDPQGGATQRFDDGGLVQTSSDGHIVRQVSSDGTTFTGFDTNGRPTSGTTAAGVPFTMTYDPSGGATETLATGETVQTDPQGHTVRQVTPDGTTFTDFDADGRPTSGTTADGDHFTMSYDTHGDTFFQSDDGSVVETDSQGHVIQTWTTHGTANDWRVDLAALNSAIGQISAERDAIHGNAAQLKASFARIETLWDSPAGMSFHTLSNTFTQVSDALIGLLDEAVNRMQTTYRNYMDTETTNVANLQ